MSKLKSMIYGKRLRYVLAVFLLSGIVYFNYLFADNFMPRSITQLICICLICFFMIRILGGIIYKQFSGTMATTSVHSLYLAYPCSVDAGVDPVKYTEKIIRRIHDIELNDVQAAQTLRGELSSLIPECDMSSSDKKLTKNAKTLKEPWGHAVHEDKTMMEDDMSDVAEYSEKMGFIQHGINKPHYDGFTMPLEPLRVIDEFCDEHISHVQGFLNYIPVPQNGLQNDIIRFLYLCGHGLSDELAGELHDNPADDNTRKSPVWPWEFCSCKETMNLAPSVITGEAQKGDIVVFSSGLLTPEWVVEKLREYERSPNRVHNTIIFVIDACYSGTWITRIQECLTGQPLHYTRVIVQTSCGEKEVSYGGYFTPVFCALQDTKKRIKLQRLYKKDKGVVKGIELFCNQSSQTPAVYDIGNDNSRNNPNFYFIHDHDKEFFEFCSKYLAKIHWGSSRGIPSSGYEDFFQSFSSSGSAKPTILGFQLKHMQENDTPLALFLIEWRKKGWRKKKKYFLHLHFDNFRNLNLTRINHFDVTYNQNRYKYIEVADTREKIRRQDRAWNDYVEPNKSAMIEQLKTFAQCKLAKDLKNFPLIAQRHTAWADEESWRMREALPRNLIQSRSACFQEAKEKAKLKSLLA